MGSTLDTPVGDGSPLGDPVGPGVDHGPGPPTLTLPKGGGAIRNIGEKFTTNPVLGTATMSVPIATTPGRSGFGPALGLAYNSGSGNGPFGFGWSLDLPAITRKTATGLPRYRDATDSDVFMLAGAEDLVPLLAADGTPFRDATLAAGFRIDRYRPRIEGGFARIERWTRLADGDVHWRSLDAGNVLTVYGGDPSSRIADPADPRRVFSWLIAEVRDDKGNAVRYDYRAEDGAGVDLSAVNERNRGGRDDPRRTAMRYPKRIRYGNRRSFARADGSRASFLADADWAAADWMFELVFDYGDHDPAAPGPNDDTARGDDGALKYPWPVRPDAFSTYRSGFEVRTSRLCRRALMFHHFANEAGVGDGCLVASTDLVHSSDPPGDPAAPIYSFLTAARQTGYIRAGAGYSAKSLPPVAFTYSMPVVADAVETVDPADLANLPIGLDGSTYRWTDLHGEGTPGILSEQGGGWLYKRNLSPLGTDDPDAPLTVRFAPVETVAPRPNVGLADGGVLADIDGDGATDLAVFDRAAGGLFRHDAAESWEPFRAFAGQAGIDFADPNLRFVDLDGDGRPDVLVTCDDALQPYLLLGEDGFVLGDRLAMPADDERGPRLVFADGTESVYLADMSGDGLTDLVRIVNGTVCYWPNLGYGRFGAKVTMTGSPRFDDVDQFHQDRVRVADIDGSGTADLIYLHRDGVRLYFNRSGNGFGPAQRLNVFPRVDDLLTIIPVDLLGNGTACLVWSSPQPGDAPRSLRFVRLMGADKPHLMTGSVNNMGAETRVHYVPSTRFYLEDRRDGRPWVTRLPFPVHVVARTETIDHVSRCRFVSRFAYHHGYFDPVDREFRGFGMVEQWDSEAFADYVLGTVAAGSRQDTTPEVNQPPMTSRSWFDTGAWLERAALDERFTADWYAQQHFLPPIELPAGLDADEAREAARALKGTLLRREVYSDDGTAAAGVPYSVAETCPGVRCLQRRQGQRFAVFQPIGRETLTATFERDPADPVVSQGFTLASDVYGRPLRSCVVAYGRRLVDPALPPEVTRDQRQSHVAYAETDYTVDVAPAADPTTYRLGTGYATRSFEVTGLAPAGALFGRDEIAAGIAAAATIAYEVVADGVTAQRRLVSRHETRFLANDLTPLPAGRIGSLGLPGISYGLAFTPAVVDAFYAGAVADADMTAAGYVHLDGDADWWIPSGTAVFPADPAAHFFLVAGARDPFGLETVIVRDAYDYLTEQVSVRQAAWAVTTAANDYRALAPVLVTDANGNRAAVAIDELGMVVASAVMGKAGSADGDTLADPTVRIEYDLFNWMNTGRPVFAHGFARERHGAGNPRFQESFTYSNGGGGVVLVKAQAHPGKALSVAADGTAVEVDADPRWVGNGRTIVNNKGRPVKAYQPYFSTTSGYEDEQALREIGVTPVMFYDPPGRSIRTVFPDGTLVRAEFTPWRQTLYDATDTVLDSRWYRDRGSPDPAAEPEPADPDRRAAWLAAKHANTPTVVHAESLGRALCTMVDYGGGVIATVRGEADLTGRFAEQFDAAGRSIAAGFTGMAGTPIRRDSAEKGRRWTFLDILGRVVRTWDEHGRSFRAAYDDLHRPIAGYGKDGEAAEVCLNYMVYGDRLPDGRDRNLLGLPHLLFDSAGRAKVDRLDFTGNPASVERLLVRDHRAMPDWSALPGAADVAGVETAAAPLLDTESFVAGATYDALGRALTITHPDGTVVVPTYNEANFVTTLTATIGGAGAPLTILAGQDFDAKGQRQFCRHGNGVVQTYAYDAFTFRLTDLVTAAAGADPATASLQSLHYTYDASGNVAQYRDDAQQTHYFSNAVVAPERRYEYDAVYQLIRATGREFAGIANDQVIGPTALAGGALPNANAVDAVRTYTETYTYDLLGNLRTLSHRFKAQAGIGDGWTRQYRYAVDADPADRTNRLIATSAPGDPDAGPFTATYDHDAYGNMVRMPHLARLDWNVLDQLREVDLGGGGTAFYTYDGGGQRIRKVIEQNGDLDLEWLTIGAVAIFRRRRRSTGALLLERRTIRIGDDTGVVAQVDTKTVDTDDADPANPLGAALIRYQYGDRLGSAVLETDETGAAISYEEYHPFGTSAYRLSAPGRDLSLKRYRFSGKEFDDETGLYYFGARYYAPWLGRWTSSDPAGLASGLNLFAYCSNNPIMRHDPTGLDDQMISITNKPENIRKAQHTHTEAAGAEYEAWIRAQTVKIDGEVLTASGGHREWNEKAGHWWIVDNVLVPVTAGTDGDGGGASQTPTRAGITAVQEGARPKASSAPDPVARTRVGEPRTFTPGEPLKGPYNLWSNEPGGGTKSAAANDGFIMEDTEFEDAAEAIAKNKGYTGRYDSNLRYGTSDFNEVWHPTSNALARDAGLSQMGVESHGIDAASLARNPGYNPAGSVQVTREIPRVRGYGGAMAGLGILSGGLMLWGASGVENRGVRYTGYASGGLEIAGSLRYVQGLVMLGRAPGSAAAMTQGAMLGRVAGGVGMIVMSTYGLVTDIQNEQYGTTLGDTAGIVAGGAVLAGSGPVAAIAGSVMLANFAGHWVSSKFENKAVGVAAGTATGAAIGAAAGAAIGVWFFGVGAVPGALIGGAIGAIAGFFGSIF